MLAAGYLLYAFPPLKYIEPYIDAKALGVWVDQQGFFGMLVFVIFATCTAAVGLPRQLIALIAGYSFGLFEGVLLAISSISFGALLTFWFARFVARPWVRQRFPEAIVKLDSLIVDQAFLKILTIRFLPLGTNMLTNLAAGTTQLPAKLFFSASFLGFLPQSTLFVLGGNGLNINSSGQISLSVFLLLLSSLLCWFLYRKHKQHLEPPLDS